MDAPSMLSIMSDHGFTDTSTARKVEALNDAIWDVESRETWTFLEGTIDLTYAGSTDLASNAPTNLRAVLNVHDISNGNQLRRIRLDEFQNMMGPSGDYTTAGPPIYYYVEAGAVKVYPLPAAGTAVRMKYMKTQTAVSATSLETDFLMPPRHHRVHVLGALSLLYDMEDDPELAARFEDRFERRIKTIVADFQKQQYDRPETVLVTDVDDWDNS